MTTRLRKILFITAAAAVLIPALLLAVHLGVQRLMELHGG
jgi:hypothetical protein